MPVAFRQLCATAAARRGRHRTGSVHLRPRCCCRRSRGAPPVGATASAAWKCRRSRQRRPSRRCRPSPCDHQLQRASSPHRPPWRPPSRRAAGPERLVPVVRPSPIAPPVPVPPCPGRPARADPAAGSRSHCPVVCFRLFLSIHGLARPSTLFTSSSVDCAQPTRATPTKQDMMTQVDHWGRREADVVHADAFPERDLITHASFSFEAFGTSKCPPADAGIVGEYAWSGRRCGPLHYLAVYYPSGTVRVRQCRHADAHRHSLRWVLSIACGAGAAFAMGDPGEQDAARPLRRGQRCRCAAKDGRRRLIAYRLQGPARAAARISSSRPTSARRQRPTLERLGASAPKLSRLPSSSRSEDLRRRRAHPENATNRRRVGLVVVANPGAAPNSWCDDDIEDKLARVFLVADVPGDDRPDAGRMALTATVLCASLPGQRRRSPGGTTTTSG